MLHTIGRTWNSVDMDTGLQSDNVFSLDMEEYRRWTARLIRTLLKSITDHATPNKS